MSGSTQKRPFPPIPPYKPRQRPIRAKRQHKGNSHNAAVAASKLKAAIESNATHLDFSCKPLYDEGLRAPILLAPGIGEATSLTSISAEFAAVSALSPEIGFLTSLKSLNLSLNQITSLPNALTKLSSTLTSLDISNNCLVSLDPLGQMSALRILLVRSQFPPPSSAAPDQPPRTSLLTSSSQLLSALGYGNSALESLALDGTPCDSLPPQMAQLTSLRALTLSNCYIGPTLDPILTSFESLEHLALNGNPTLREFPASIAASLTSLEHLSLWDTALSTLPATLSKATSLARLDLSCQNEALTEFPHVLGSLPCLTYLSLSHNAISAIPHNFFTGPTSQSLVILNLAQCDLVTLPDAFSPKISSLPHTLKELYLVANEYLSSLPPSIGALQSLTILSLKGCTSLTTLPWSISALPQSTVVKTSGAAVEAVPSGPSLLPGRHVTPSQDPVPGPLVPPSRFPTLIELSAEVITRSQELQRSLRDLPVELQEFISYPQGKCSRCTSWMFAPPGSQRIAGSRVDVFCRICFTRERLAHVEPTHIA